MRLGRDDAPGGAKSVLPGTHHRDSGFVPSHS